MEPLPGPPLYMIIPMGIIGFLVLTGVILVFSVVIFRMCKQCRRGGPLLENRRARIYRPPPTNNMTTTLPIITHTQSTAPIITQNQFGGSSAPPTGWAVSPPYNPNYSQGNQPMPPYPAAETVPIYTNDPYSKNSFGT